jgi:hypothetical protein
LGLAWRAIDRREGGGDTHNHGVRNLTASPLQSSPRFDEMN